jgi:hemolysin activation/secretion protein
MVVDRTPFTAYAGVDNTGLEHIQRTRLFGGCTWGKKQQMTLQYSMAPDINKFFSISGSYILPLPIQHIINVFGGYSRVHASVPATTRTHGHAIQASLRYTIPLPATNHILQEMFAGFDFKRYNNTLIFVESFPRIGQTVNLTQWLAGYLLGYEHGRNKLSWDAQLIFSPFQWIPDQSSSTFESLNPFASHAYVYGRSSINYKLMLSKRFYWTLYASGQLANTTLLPSEQFGVGGYSTVRGYEERQLNGDYGFLAKTELAFYSGFNANPTSSIDARLELLAFLDYGLTANHHAVPGESSFAYLLGVGPGLRYSLSHYLATRLDWGIKIHRDHYPGGWSMVHFSMVGSF